VVYLEAVLLNDFHLKDKSQSEFPLNELIEHFSLFKGVGKKSAQRMALESILLAPEKIRRFSDSLLYARENIKFCETCFYLTWSSKCHVCLDEKRVQDTICVVAEPKDVLSINQSQHYNGLFHVLGGVISPLDRIYPEMLRFKELKQRLEKGCIKSIILALNPTVEGDATVLYLQEYLQSFNIEIYKLAQGIPVGSDVGYLDDVTISKAFEGKRLL
jgi:recombination protein RecR